jgi:hypothetical protein
VVLTHEEEVPGFRTRMQALYYSSKTDEIRKFITKSEPETVYGLPKIGESRGYIYKIQSEEKEYIFENVASLQVAREIEAAFVIRSVALDEKGGSYEIHSSYYQPFDELRWERTSIDYEGQRGSFSLLSPSGYVVEYSRYKGELLFIGISGNVYAKYSLYEPNEIPNYQLRNYVATGKRIHRGGRTQSFSEDGKIFAFVISRTELPEYGDGTSLLIFDQTGNLLFKKNFLEDSPGQVLVSPDGKRILVSLKSLGSGTYKNKIPGIKDSKCYLLTDSGRIIREIDALCWDAIFSENGKKLLVNDYGERVILLSSEEGNELQQFEVSNGERIVGLAINEKAKLVGIIMRSRYHKEQLHAKFYSFDKHVTGELILIIPGHEMRGPSDSYSFLFDKDGSRFAFATKNKVIRGEINPSPHRR